MNLKTLDLASKACCSETFWLFLISHNTFSWHYRYWPIFLLPSVTLFLVSGQDLGQCESWESPFTFMTFDFTYKFQTFFFFPRFFPRILNWISFAKLQLCFAQFSLFKHCREKVWALLNSLQVEWTSIYHPNGELLRPMKARCPCITWNRGQVWASPSTRHTFCGGSISFMWILRREAQF